jgi:transcriptional regulator of acetoin/glycerol metabolism
MDSLLNPYFYAYNPELLAFENAWVNFMKGGGGKVIKESVIKPQVAESWIRCRERGLDPMKSENLALLSRREIDVKLEENQTVLEVVVPYMDSLYEIVKGSGFIIHYVDADGFILKSIGDRDTMEIAEKTLSLPGANRLEETAGTSSIALAVITKKPIQVAGAEHYAHAFHRWTCSAAPVLNDAGEVICTISVAGRYEMIHQHTLGMVSSVARAIENEIRIRSINAQLKNEIKVLSGKIKHRATYEFSDIIGISKAIRESKALALRAAEHNVRVVLEGESGTGKEMFAQAIHNKSARRDSPFVAVDCGAVPIELLESELFGYDGGAFTGAKREGKPGLFELADGGTIFFDEIGNMPNEMQQKLLRVLQESVVVRVGGTKQIPVDVRVIDATNVKLEDRIEDGLFRSDLYYRLNVVHIKMPALRERREDIPLIISAFLSGMPSTKRKRVDKRAMAVLTSCDWPGNIRQLQNAIEYAAIMCKNDAISAEDLPLELQKGQAIRLMVRQERQPNLEQAMGEYVRHVVDASNDNISRAAKVLGVSRSTVYKFIRKERDENDA